MVLNQCFEVPIARSLCYKHITDHCCLGNYDFVQIVLFNFLDGCNGYSEAQKEVLILIKSRGFNS